MYICDYVLCFYIRIMYDLIPVYELYILLASKSPAFSMSIFIKTTSKVYLNIFINIFEN